MSSFDLITSAMRMFQPPQKQGMISPEGAAIVRPVETPMQKQERLVKTMDSHLLDKAAATQSAPMVSKRSRQVQPAKQPMGKPEVKGITTQRQIDPGVMQRAVAESRHPQARNLSGEQYDLARRAIKQAAMEFGIPHAAGLMEDIAFAESSLNPQSQSNLSSAQGLFQYLDKTWDWLKQIGVLDRDANKLDPFAQARATAYALSKGYTSWWDESRRNWGSYYSQQDIDNALRKEVL